MTTGSRKKTSLRGSEKTGISLSEVLRDLYRHGIEFCLLFSPAMCHPVFSKDQIISVLEKDEGERKVCELPDLCPSFSTLDDLVNRKVLEGEDRLLALKEEELVVLSASSLLKVSREGQKTPPWWKAPVPLVSWAEGRFLANKSAKKLLGGASLRRGEGAEFFCEGRKGKGFLLKEVSPSVFLVDDVSEDMGAAREMAWWAAIGKAFVSKIEACGGRVEEVDGGALPEDDLEDFLTCLWDDEILGYLKVSHGKKP